MVRVLLFSFVLLIACGGPAAQPAAPLPTETEAGAADSAADDAGAADSTPGAEAGLPAGAPDTPAGRQLAWVLGVFAGAALDRAAIEAHFEPQFLAAIPADQIAAVFDQFKAQVGRASVTRVDAEGDARLVAHVTSQDPKKAGLVVSLSVSAAGKMDRLLFTPEQGPPPPSMSAAIEKARGLAPRAQLLVAELDNGSCRQVHALEPSAQLAIGSTFKLYVLLALADRVRAGKARWPDEITIREEWKSLPSGVTQNDPAGAKHSLRTLAERMISISDNTATDHLLYALGRERVEAAVRASGHSRPELNTPFLGTRELFLFKLDLPPAEVERYSQLGPARRRASLARLARKRPSLASAGAWTSARHIGSIEWFASAGDLCRAMAALWMRGQEPTTAPVLEVLSKNPLVEIDRTTWPYAGFKGGSEPGVLNLTWLLRRADGKWFVIALGFNANEGEALDEKAIINLATGVIQLVGREGR